MGCSPGSPHLATLDLGSLAAFNAETGNVAEAVKWHSRAIELLTNEKSKELEDLPLLQHGEFRAGRDSVTRRAQSNPAAVDSLTFRDSRDEVFGYSRLVGSGCLDQGRRGT
jgi:hypothetical protein